MEKQERKLLFTAAMFWGQFHALVCQWFRMSCVFFSTWRCVLLFTAIWILAQYDNIDDNIDSLTVRGSINLDQSRLHSNACRDERYCCSNSTAPIQCTQWSKHLFTAATNVLSRQQSRYEYTTLAAFIATRAAANGFVILILSWRFRDY